MAKSIIQDGYKTLNSINLGREFVTDNKLVPGKRYSILIEGSDTESYGTLQHSGVIGGFAALYRNFPDLQAGTEIEVEYDGTRLRVSVPDAEPKIPATDEEEGQKYVLDVKEAHRVHIEPYAPGSLNTWEPKGEPDVYMVFGRLAEYTKYRYCCAASTEILRKFGIDISPTPDAVLIEEGSDRYLIAEFEVASKKFKQHDHKKEDVDILVCWVKSHPPEEDHEYPRLLVLKDLVADLIATGGIEL